MAESAERAPEAYRHLRPRSHRRRAQFPHPPISSGSSDLIQREPGLGYLAELRGFREVEFPDRKAPAVFRIICLGDSWTFGHNVAQDEAYPQRLRALLKQEFPEANFEILNIGVPGYSSYQGVKLLKRFTTLEPDVVVIAYAINDLGMTGFHAEDISAVKVVKK